MPKPIDDIYQVLEGVLVTVKVTIGYAQTADILLTLDGVTIKHVKGSSLEATIPNPTLDGGKTTLDGRVLFCTAAIPAIQQNNIKTNFSIQIGGGPTVLSKTVEEQASRVGETILHSATITFYV